MSIIINDSIRNELERIRLTNECQMLLPSEVVEASRDPQSPLHDMFMWSRAGDKQMALAGRLDLARQLIVRVKVTFTLHEEKTVRVRNYVSMPSDRVTTGGYRDIRSVITSPPHREELILTAARELAAFQKKWEILKDIADFWGSIKEARDGLDNAAGG